MHPPHLHGPRTLAVIAAFKFVKSLLLFALALALLRLRHLIFSKLSFFDYNFAQGSQLIC